MDTKDRAIVEVLALQDALWGPRRATDQDFVADANFYAGRRAFAATGVPWTSDERDEAARKSDRRCIERLAANGLVQLDCSSKTLGVRLTDVGEAHTRSLIGLPWLPESYVALCALIYHGGAGWICECVLVCNSRTASYSDLGRRAGRLLAANDAIFLPALGQGCVKSRSDADGRVFFQITESGLEWIAAGEPQLPTDLPGVDAAALAHYLPTRNARREVLRTAEPSNSTEVGPHLLSSGGPVRAADGVSSPPRRHHKRARSTSVSEKSNA